MAAATNNRKLADFNALTVGERNKMDDEDYDAAVNWIEGVDPRNCEEALELLKKVPPVRLGGDSTKTKQMSKSEWKFTPPERVILDADWMDNVIETTDFRATLVSLSQRRKLAKFLHQHRRSPPETEKVERSTDNFHHIYILEPACAIAELVTGQPMAPTYSASSEGVQSDLHVQAKGDSGKKFITVENKRGIVWAEHEEAFLDLLNKQILPDIVPAVKPPPAVRICIQINAQMITHSVLYAKLFSPIGVVYVRRDTVKRHMFFSRVYHDLDDDIRRTACLLLQASKQEYNVLPPPFVSIASFSPSACFIPSWIRQQALKLFLTVSYLCGIRTVAIGPDGRWSFFHGVDHYTSLMLPRVFTRFIGAGASGNVWQSSDGTHVIKIFDDGNVARHEAEILQRCLQDPKLAVPTFRGLYTDGHENFAIITPYVGTALGSIYEVEESKQRQLVETLHALHRNGIHHHDVRPDNVLVNEQGEVTLIDFDRACRIDGPCENCSDLAVISALARDTRDSNGGSVSPYSM
ncbi:hypothetical protein C8R44DRAFT_974059 [Mycena epipterygia]|nr:hypothetical protein C8R44DRAFT_974059 [Mycena epipterygia]